MPKKQKTHGIYILYTYRIVYMPEKQNMYILYSVHDKIVYMLKKQKTNRVYILYI